MTLSKILFYFCLSFIGGVFLSSFSRISSLFLLSFLIWGIFLISVFFKHKRLVIVGFCILFFVFGIFRYQQFLLKIEHNELKKLKDRQTVEIVGIVDSEPDLREKTAKLKIEIKEVVGEEDLQGKILVTTWPYPQYYYGDELKIVGKLQEPKEFEGFNYKGYLTKEGVVLLSYFPKIELLKRGNYQGLGRAILAKVLQFKARLRESIQQNLSPPQSSLLVALILGDKRQISQNLKEKLNRAGIRHITAVSGLHVAVLTTLLMTLFVGIGFFRQQAFYFVLIFLTLFIILTGFQSSAIRAGIMAFFFLFAQYLGKMNTSSRTIVFAATLMLIQNPLLLKFDVGFQLSFLALTGIIYLWPIFQDWLAKFPVFLKLRNLLSITFAAQIFTLPILIYNFGYFSLVAPLTNTLIVPLLPYIIGLGFVFGIAGTISPPLGWLLSFPSWLLLTYLLKIIDFFSQSWSFKTLEISWPWLVISYLILGLITWQLQQNRKLKFLQY